MCLARPLATQLCVCQKRHDKSSGSERLFISHQVFSDNVLDEEGEKEPRPVLFTVPSIGIIFTMRMLCLRSERWFAREKLDAYKSGGSFSDISICIQFLEYRS